MIDDKLTKEEVMYGYMVYGAPLASAITGFIRGCYSAHGQSINSLYGNAALFSPLLVNIGLSTQIVISSIQKSYNNVFPVRSVTGGVLLPLNLCSKLFKEKISPENQG